MLNKRVLIANFKLTYRRTLNRLIYFSHQAKIYLNQIKFYLSLRPFSWCIYLFYIKPHRLF